MRGWRGLPKTFSDDALDEDLAVIEEDDLGGDRGGEADLVGDDEHGDPGRRQRAHDVEDVAGQLGVERGGRLVEEQDARLERQGAGDRHALLLAAGELGRVVAGAVGEADGLELNAGLGLGVLAGEAADADQGLGDVAEGGHVRPEVELLEDHADVAAHRADGAGGQAHALARRAEGVAEGLAVDLDQAAGRLLEEGDAAEQRRLARARRADDAGDLAARRREVDAVEDAGLAEGLGEAADADGRGGRRAHANRYLARRRSAVRPRAPQASTRAQ